MHFVWYVIDTRVYPTSVTLTYITYSTAHYRNAVLSAVDCAFTHVWTPFHIQSIKCLFYSPVSLQLICSFMAAFTAFPSQTRWSCSRDSFGSMGNKLSKTQSVSGNLGQVTTLWWHGCRLNWYRSALDWENERDPGAYTVMAISCGASTYWCLLMPEIIKMQNVH